jgi:hypothetical protein
MMDVVFAVETRHVGNGLTVHKGQHWPVTDPVVEAYPALFSTDPRYGLVFSPNAVPPEMSIPPDEEASVEQATAGPGERRNARRPRGGVEF